MGPRRDRGRGPDARRGSDLVRDQLRERTRGESCRAAPAPGLPARAPLRAFTVRKEAKAHGTGKLVEGPFEAGDRVAIIEDVITTGGSARRAVEAVRAAGGQRRGRSGARGSRGGWP